MNTLDYEAEETILRCANCGVNEAQHIKKLKACTACKSVRYCGIKCQLEHWPKHKKACKQRAAELRDEVLFKQPESTHLGDCPICCLPLPLDARKTSFAYCCSQTLCGGCNVANAMRNIEGGLERKCLFCCRSFEISDAENHRNLMKRVEANDPHSTHQLGTLRYNSGDHKGAFEYYLKASKLGSVKAHCSLAAMYSEGVYVEKDNKKAMHFMELAAIGGHPTARYNLGSEDIQNGKPERAVRHWIIGARLGSDRSMKALRDIYSMSKGLVSKEELAATLREYQAAVDATKSPQREAAELYTP